MPMRQISKSLINAKQGLQLSRVSFLFVCNICCNFMPCVRHSFFFFSVISQGLHFTQKCFSLAHIHSVQTSLNTSEESNNIVMVLPLHILSFLHAVYNMCHDLLSNPTKGLADHCDICKWFCCFRMYVLVLRNV